MIEPTQARRPVAVCGTGLLYSAICDELGARALPMPSKPRLGGCEMVVLASDAWDTGGFRATRQLAASLGVPWLPVRTELAAVIAGPVELPGQPGCVECARLRRWRILPNQDEYLAAWQAHGTQLAGQPSPWLTGLAAQLVAALVADEAAATATGAAARTRCAQLWIDLPQLTVRRDAFLPDPTCHHCGDLPPDSAEQAQVSLQPRPAYQPAAYRVRDISAELDALTSAYVNEKVGLVRSLNGWSDGGFVVTAATCGSRNGSQTAGYGRATSFRGSQLTALLEALERYGSTPGGRRTSVTGSYTDLRDRALDPHELGLHSLAQHQLPGFHYQPFSPDQPYRWVWGWSFARAEPILVPESYAYYNLPHDDRAGHGFVYEISNGCALGGCLEEAILYAVLELAERDSFLLTWYARLPAARIDLTTARDRSVSLLAATIRAETGYEVAAFDTTVEQGIPCVWTMAVNPATDGRPAIACAAGSSPEPELAIRNGLAELGPMLNQLTRRFADRAEATRARRMVDQPELVREMHDHSLLYADPRAASRLAFLPDSPTRTVADIGRADRGGFDADDLRDNLLEAVRRYTGTGLDVVVVDQTSPEHQVGGLHCVKAIIPGTLPMTFGHQYRRTEGLPRLCELPVALGYRNRPPTWADLNPHPHPFP